MRSRYSCAGKDYSIPRMLIVLQPVFIEILGIPVVCVLYFTWIGPKFLALGEFVFHALSPRSESWTTLFRAANSLLLVNTIILVLHHYFHYVGDSLDSITEFESPNLQGWS